jgi:hypothetical protein
MPGLVSVGAKAEGPTNVQNPTTLSATVPTSSTVGDWWFCHTACTSTTATVATPAGWQVVYVAGGTAGQVALFARKTDGTETAPDITWTGVTTGNSGTPSLARILNWGTGFAESGGALVIDVLGTASSLAASATAVAGGADITVAAPYAIVFSHGMRQDDAATGIADIGTGVAWASTIGDNTISGTDMMHITAWGITDGPGDMTHSWTLTGANSAISSGVMVALKLERSGEPGQLQYTRGRR